MKKLVTILIIFLGCFLIINFNVQNNTKAYFVPSIGISDVENYKEKLLVASMGSKIEEGDLSLYTYSIDENLKLFNKKINKIYQRIRDIEVFNGHVFLFLESTGSIGVFPLKEIM